MHIISKRRLREATTRHPVAAHSLALWTRVTDHARWHNLADVRQDWPSADNVGRLTVFNIAGNKFRLIAFVDFKHGKVFIRDFMTHADYSKGSWKHDAWF